MKESGLRQVVSHRAGRESEMKMSGFARTLARRALPAPLRRHLLNATAILMDALERIRHPQDILPPRRLRFVGHGDFRRTGEEFLGHFIRLGGLKPDQSVLDVGSGIGRMAIPLTRYLSPKGRYEGLEIVPSGVEWCAENITPKFPNFRFHGIDVYNFEYNPTGTQKASSYRFPFEDKTFDFSFLTSVFTHMLPADIENYVSELGRVTKPGGRCLVTLFLLNEDSRTAIRNGECPILDFRYEGPGYMTVDEKMPECAIAFPEEIILEVFQKSGFQLVPPLHFGAWSGRAVAPSYQDIALFEKVA